MLNAEWGALTRRGAGRDAEDSCGPRFVATERKARRRAVHGKSAGPARTKPGPEKGQKRAAAGRDTPTACPWTFRGNGTTREGKKGRGRGGTGAAWQTCDEAGREERQKRARPWELTQRHRGTEGGESAGKTCFHTMENGFAEGEKQVSIVWKSVLGGKMSGK
jgi:hypothetical protein